MHRVLNGEFLSTREVSPAGSIEELKLAVAEKNQFENLDAYNDDKLGISLSATNRMLRTKIDTWASVLGAQPIAR